jgi:hypothetical protein
MKMNKLFIITTLFVAGPCFADWTLDNDSSQISFVSVKAGDAGEVHRFTEISGGLSMRDERMRELLFQTEMFPTASLSANIDMDALNAIEAGDSTDMAANVALDLHGHQVTLAADMIVARLGDRRLMVSSRKPIIVNASSVDLVSGVEALREIAGLPSISKAVPVSFVLTFEAD